MTKVGVPKEIEGGECRVALVPETVARLTKAGLEIRVQRGAGDGAYVRDADYEAVGAKIVPDGAALYADSDVVLKVRKPAPLPGGGHEADLLREGSILVSFLQVGESADLLERLRARRITVFSMERIPRISRAQKMDALSSQASVAGYKAVLLAADSLPKFFPMLTTAAGTIRPARVFVIGAGVAGLQAIATARRLGAVVHAFDIRPAVKEQVESLGANFVGLDLAAEETETAGGYAKEVGEDVKRRERERIREEVKAADVVITAAQVPGRRAPILITEAMVRAMTPGSVIVDLASETGGNCEWTRPGERVERDGVILHGPIGLPSQLPLHASQMYSRNVSSLLLHLIKDGQPHLDFEDPIVSETCVAHAGELRYERAKTAAG